MPRSTKYLNHLEQSLYTQETNDHKPLSLSLSLSLSSKRQHVTFPDAEAGLGEPQNLGPLS
jgi:hypothetical protein